jgi:hypothetical protein
MGTSYHSVVKVPGYQINANIYTTNYPGMFYQIKLFASNNGSETSKGIGFGISGTVAFRSFLHAQRRGKCQYIIIIVISLFKEGNI